MCAPFGAWLAYFVHHVYFQMIVIAILQKQRDDSTLTFVVQNIFYGILSMVHKVGYTIHTVVIR